MPSKEEDLFLPQRVLAATAWGEVCVCVFCGTHSSHKLQGSYMRSDFGDLIPWCCTPTPSILPVLASTLLATEVFAGCKSCFCSFPPSDTRLLTLFGSLAFPLGGHSLLLDLSCLYCSPTAADYTPLRAPSCHNRSPWGQSHHPPTSCTPPRQWGGGWAHGSRERRRAASFPGRLLSTEPHPALVAEGFEEGLDINGGDGYEST